MFKKGQFFKIKNKQDRELICLKLYDSNIAIFVILNDIIINNEICSISDNVFDFQILEYRTDFYNDDLDKLLKIKSYIKRKASEFYEFEHIPLDELHYIFNGRLVRMFNDDEMHKSTQSDKKYIYDAKKK